MRRVVGFGGGDGGSAASSGSVTAAAGEGEEELELGLSLGAKKAVRCCRILTAGDFTAWAPRGSPPASPSASSSSVSSSSAAGGGRAEAAMQEETPSRRGGGSGNGLSQVQVVGWPPIRAFRMNSLFHHSKDNSSVAVGDSASSDDKKSGGGKEAEQQQQGRKKGRSLFVKVNMDGDPIGRKVDLNAHHSYQGLASALDLMFRGPAMPPTASSRHGVQRLNLLDGSSEYKLTYEDKDGDWMLVGDVPWGMFLDTVKRLRIMRTSDNSGLVSRVQSSNKFGGLIGSKLS